MLLSIGWDIIISTYLLGISLCILFYFTTYHGITANVVYKVALAFVVFLLALISVFLTQYCQIVLYVCVGLCVLILGAYLIDIYYFM